MKKQVYTILVLLGILGLLFLKSELKFRADKREFEHLIRDSAAVERIISEQRLKDWEDSTSIRDSIYKLNKAAYNRLQETLEDVMLGRPRQRPIKVRIVE